MTCLPSDPSRTAPTDRAAGSSTCGDDGRSRSDIPVIVARPLTTAAFAPYGVVVEHLGLERRLHLTEAFAAQPEAKTPSLWISRIKERTALPLVVDRMERHPYSNQTFVPLGPTRLLVVVALGDERGAADPATLAAFVAQPGQGVTYHRNVWHFGLSTLEAPADFLVAMSVTGENDDAVFEPLAHPIRVSATLHPDR